MNKLNFWIFIIYVFSGSVIHAQGDHQQLFQEANDLFIKNQYQEAIGKYQAIESAGLESYDLYFNRARAHYALNENVLSLVYLERCLKINPQHDEALVAKQGIINQLDNPIVSFQEKGFKQKWISWFQFLSANTWSYLFILSLLCILALSIMSLKSILRIPAIFKWLVSLLALIFFTNAWVLTGSETTSDFGLVNVKSAQIFSTADVESTVKNEVTQAQKLKILDMIAEWYKIQLPNRETGWILKDHLIAI